MGKTVIKVLNGPIEGKIYPLKNGMLFGRSMGDIVIGDKSISDPHAKIEIYSSGQIMLEDQESKNGIFINGQKKVKTVLEVGTQFSLGKIEFEVVLVKLPEEIWLELLEKASSSVSNELVELKPFYKEIHLTVLKGPQQGSIFVLSYGPRSFGSESVDSFIFGKHVPEEAFDFIPQKNKILFRTSFPDAVQLNREKTSEAVIQNKDIIYIFDVQIQIELKNIK